MESKEQAEDDGDYKPSPSSTSGQQLHNFVIVSEERNIKCFRWEITNFSDVNDESIFSDYFSLADHRFRFQLFPKGEESRKTWTKYLGLDLETDDSDIVALRNKPTCFICSEVVIVNHVDDSKSKRKYIYHRYAYWSTSSGHKDIVSLDFLQGSRSEFLLNGTDLHINCDVRVLEEIWHGQRKPQDRQPDASSASSSTGVRTENDRGVYEGKFAWTIKNYSLFAERLKNDGMLESPAFKMGETMYSIHFECKRNHSSTGGNEKYLSLFMNREDSKGNRSPFCVMAFALWNWKTDTVARIERGYGRLGAENVSGVGWIKLMGMSDFENPDHAHIGDNDKVRFVVQFFTLRENDSLCFNMANAETIWNFERGPVVSSSAQMGAENVLTTYQWEIKNVSSMVDLAKLYKIKHPIIRSRPIKIGEHEFRMALLPFGMLQHPLHIGLCIESPLRADETSFLVHFRFGLLNQIDVKNTKMKEKLVRCDTHGVYGLHDHLIRIQDFYGLPGREIIVDGRVVIAAYFHLVEENLLEEELSPLAGDRQRKRITWEVDNFLSWNQVAGLTIGSRFFTVEGCKFRIVIVVDASDGRVTAALHPDPILEQAGDTCTLIYRFSAMNRNRILIPQWHGGLNIEGKKDSIALGHVSDFVREGYIANDKMVFSCEIAACLLLKHESIEDDRLEI